MSLLCDDGDAKGLWFGEACEGEINGARASLEVRSNASGGLFALGGKGEAAGGETTSSE